MAQPRRTLAPIKVGLCPWFGLCPSDQSIQGAAPNESAWLRQGEATASHPAA